MSDPKRWLEADAPPHVRPFLRAGRATPPIDQALRVRLGQYVAKAASVQAKGSLAAMKGIAAIGIVAAAGYGAAKLSTAHSGRTTPSAPEVAPAPVAAPAIAEPEVEPNATDVAAVIPAPPAQPPSKQRRVAPPEGAAMSELEFVERARSLLAGSAAEALRLANQRAEKFPNGRLGPEAEMVAIQALERLGRVDAARARSDAALARYPGSIYADSWRRRTQATR